MNQSIIKPFQLGDPSHEILKSASDFLIALLRQYPGLHFQVKNGFDLCVTDPTGKLIVKVSGQMEGGSYIVPINGLASRKPSL